MKGARANGARPDDGAPVVLEVKAATKRFGAVLALDGAHLSVRRGEVLALLGDNGAGKSTLVRAITGVHRIDEGEILLDGQRIDGLGAQAVRARGVETVHQDLALFDNLSAVENLYAGRELVSPPWLKRVGFVRRRAMAESTRGLLEQLEVGLSDPHELIGLMSGGQRQAIAVGRAQTFASKVVLLDEPTAALGIRETRAVLRIVKSLPERGISVVLISHNLDQVAEVADRAVVLRRGRIVGEAVPNPENHERLVSMIVGSVG
jgi:D-xylose transport system ATP-binding protein